MAARDGDSARTTILSFLLQRIEEDRYPSSTMLDMAEALLTNDEVPRYVDLLMTKIEGDLYPSIPMMRRVMALT